MRELRHPPNAVSSGVFRTNQLSFSPSAEWKIGGTNPIGIPDTSDTFLLMNTLYRTPLGSFLERNCIKVYRWVECGGNLSTSKYTNAPAAYNVFPNRADLDQVLLAWNACRISCRPSIGLDYRYTMVKGIFSNQLLQKNRQYGYHPLLIYADLYIPKVAQGMNIRVGRFLSIPDIEAQLAPDYFLECLLFKRLDGGEVDHL